MGISDCAIKKPIIQQRHIPCSQPADRTHSHVLTSPNNQHTEGPNSRQGLFWEGLETQDPAFPLVSSRNEVSMHSLHTLGSSVGTAAHDEHTEGVFGVWKPSARSRIQNCHWDPAGTVFHARFHAEQCLHTPRSRVCRARWAPRILWLPWAPAEPRGCPHRAPGMSPGQHRDGSALSPGHASPQEGT